MSDFISASKTVLFPAGVRKICTTFEIINDKVIENDEEFEVRIDVNDPKVLIPAIVPRVKIIDNDGKLIDIVLMLFCIDYSTYTL